jgi:hypothetical protein
VRQDMQADARKQRVCARRAQRATSDRNGRGRSAPGAAQLPADFDGLVLELEGVVERVARLVLHASALLERRTNTAGDTPVSEEGKERARRLTWAIDAGQRTLQAAAISQPPVR